MLALAKSSGAYAVAVTSDPASPMAEVADAHLTSYAPDAYLQPDDLSAKHAQLFVIDLLYLLAAQRDFSRTTSLWRRPPRPSRRTAVRSARRPGHGPRPRRKEPPQPERTSRRTSRTEVRRRLDDLDQEARAGGLDAAIDLIVDRLQRGGVVQAFGTGHSQAFAMEIAGRAGGLIPTHAIALRDLVLRGSRDVPVLQGATLERDQSVADELFGLYPFDPADVFLIASNSGVNGSIVGLALRAKADGHPVIAVTSLEHTNAVTPKHRSGKRLSEIADIVIDNRAPYGDTTIDLGDGLSARCGLLDHRRLHRPAPDPRRGPAARGTRARSRRSTSPPTSREATRTTTPWRPGTAIASPALPDRSDRQPALDTRTTPRTPVSTDHHERHPTMSREIRTIRPPDPAPWRPCAAALVPLAGALASCGGSSPSAGGGGSSSAPTSATNPFSLRRTRPSTP